MALKAQILVTSVMVHQEDRIVENFVHLKTQPKIHAKQNVENYKANLTNPQLQ